MNILNMKYLLNNNQYIAIKSKKERIVLHHTAGGSAQSSIDWWNKHSDRVSTPFIIPRSGEIWQLFDESYWAYALGINSSKAEKKSIHIELANAGGLTKINGEYHTYFGKKIDQENVVTYKQKHRGKFSYERYTDAQVEAVVYLIDYLSQRFDLELGDVEKFWWYDYDSQKALISHTTLRKDKSDIHPQPNLIKAIYDLAGCDAPITE